MKLPSQKTALGIWLVSLLAAVLVVLNTTFIADLSAFMPKTPNVRQQMLVEQLKEGAIARLVLIGIEGGDATERARLSRLLAARLARDTRFSAVQNGDPATLARDQSYFFANRYALSPAIGPDRFTASGMRQGLQEMLDAMAGDGGLLVKQLLPRDPTGETLQIVTQFMGEAGPQTDQGVWVSRNRERAVLMAQLAESGLDTDRQAVALDGIRQAFASLPQRQASTRLVMSGTSVLSVASRDIIKSEVERLATLGTLLVIGLLLLVYRSFTLLLLGLLPVVTGALVGVASVSLAFGSVHGLTLGFGTTLIGEAVDYSIYLFIQRDNRQPGRFWRTIRLGVLTSVTGFAALMFSSFPGLAQLGLYSISGLVAAALVTRFVLPALMPATLGVRRMDKAGKWLETGLDRLAAFRWLPLLLLSGCLVLLFTSRHEVWNRQLSSLSPVTQAQNQLDASLRSDLGSADMRYVVSFTAPSHEQALQQSERADKVLAVLLKQQLIGGYHTPSQLLPSQASQAMRKAAIPAAPVLQVRLAEALQGMPVAADKLGSFLTDLAQARQAPMLTPQSLAGTSSAVLLDSMLIQRPQDYLVMMPLRAAGDRLDTDKVQAALNGYGLGHMTVIDLAAETSGIFDHYTHEAQWLSGIGCVAILLLLLFSCGWRQTWFVVAPVACAVTGVITLLVMLGIPLTILHLIGLLLVVALGSNYALFFADDHHQRAVEENRRMELSLLIANLATVCSFGLLGMSSVPVLSFIGSTVAIGALLSLVFAAMLVRGRRALHP
ncbi:MMPL family transporter [Leeia oryzae]|uniref:MMPL family transporter n=1 Tax=Leeia oryzae TaxID=356662 RepID=UPI000363D504|nr:MMPL family transporter [Leeia oryzae]